ncbi:MAG TPA: hypothetical protein VEH83_00255 [Gemmatimonadales bacterium]|nr:hypothetical protein [Gemmatimonadales bacterium]
MSQVVLPPPGEIVRGLMPLAGMAFVVLVTGMVVLGPVGRAIGRVITHRVAGERDQALPAGELQDLRGALEDQGGRLDALQRQVSELAERQDFAERLLAQARSQPRIPGAKDAAG